MDKSQKWVVTTVVGVILVYAAVVAASSQKSAHTPLYTYRMEQASSTMNYLPTEMNEILYTAKKGYKLNYELETEKSSNPEFETLDLDCTESYWCTWDMLCTKDMKCTFGAVCTKDFLCTWGFCTWGPYC